MRSYLAVAAVLLPEVMGSCSTDLKSGIGGLEGRHLKDGDRLATGKPSRQFAGWGVKQLPVEVASVRYRGRNTVSSIAPRKAFWFAVAAQSASNRMGYRLQGQSLTRTTDRELLSPGLLPGVVRIAL